MDAGASADGLLQARASLYTGILGIASGILGGGAGGLVGGWLALRASERAIERQVQEAAAERERQTEAAAKERQEAEGRRDKRVLRAFQAECSSLAGLINPEHGDLFHDWETLPRQTFELATLSAALPVLLEMPPWFDECFSHMLKAQQGLVRLNVALLDADDARRGALEGKAPIRLARQRAAEAREALYGAYNALDEALLLKKYD